MDLAGQPMYNFGWTHGGDQNGLIVKVQGLCTKLCCMLGHNWRKGATLKKNGLDKIWKWHNSPQPGVIYIVAGGRKSKYHFFEDLEGPFPKIRMHYSDPSSIWIFILRFIKWNMQCSIQTACMNLLIQNICFEALPGFHTDIFGFTWVISRQIKINELL